MSGSAQGHIPHVLITGGAGFIGSNLAAHILAFSDARVTVFDNLTHPGAAFNVEWLRSQARGGRFRFIRGDVRCAMRVIELVRNVDEIYHLASRCDDGPESGTHHDVNVAGTLNMLEAARCSPRKPAVLYVSTSKVYGELRGIPVIQDEKRYRSVDPVFRGFSERTCVSYQSPYDCSRRAAEQYVLDYARFYDLSATVLRADTVAGPRQFENEDHGWVSHFVYSILAGYPVTVYGSGLQVHDVLHVSDLVEALLAARAYSPITAGAAYNVGGGVANSISVNEMIELIQRLCYRPATVLRSPGRPGDRPLYYANTAQFQADTGWGARRSLEQIVRSIAAFWRARHPRFEEAVPLAWPLQSTYRRAA